MWTPGALASEARPYRNDVWRIVELQYQAATMVLVDGLAQQDLLERMLEDSKPVLPPACRGMDFLLATPFRYAPYPYGSRFRRAHQPEGAFYGAENAETAIAEIAFYRLLFFAESPGTVLPGAAVQHTAFGAVVVAEKTIDLTVGALAADAARWTHPTEYGPCQDLADAARAAGIDAIRYRSVRDPDGRQNLAVLSPAALTGKRAGMLQTWHILLRPQANAVQAWCEMPRIRLEFSRATFAADPRLA
jgi:hypothetical protein